MELQEGWDAADSLLEQIVLHAKELRKGVENMSAIPEGRPPRASILKEVDVSIEELLAAARLSQSARERLMKLRSNYVHSA
jgi:hypothetical protein